MKKNNTKTDNGKHSAGKRILSAVLSAVLVFELSPFPQMNSLFDFSDFNLSGLIAQASNKDDVPAGTVYSAEEAYIQSLYDAESGGYILANVDDVLKYSRAYYSYPDRHEDNRIIINFAGGDGTSTIPDFISIGTENNPFAGEVQFETSSNNTISIPESFFDFVLDSVKITDTDGNVTPITLTRTLSDTGEPVLAKHVKHNENYTGDVVTWQIRMNQQASNSRNTAGFIGEMKDDAKIKLEIVDYTSMSIYGIDDVGYICGKMGKRSGLTVNAFTYSSTDLDNNVVTETTSNATYGIALLDGYTGNAGGVVGSMDEDSELTLNCSMPNVSASIESKGEDTFAGGIVGYNNGGKIKFGSAITTSNKFTIQNTVTGVGGAGGVMGYYKPAFNDPLDEIDVSLLAIGTDASHRAVINGDGSIGGVIGKLDNEISVTENDVTTYSSGNIKIFDNSNNASIVYINHSSDYSDNGGTANYGGLIGTYTACDLTSSLVIKDISANVARSGGSYQNYGGCIGETVGGNGNTDNKLYVLFDDYQVTVASGNDDSDSVYGGLIAASNNAFIDAKNITASSTGTFYGGGVIGQMEDGILRLIDTTSLNGAGVNVANGKRYVEGQIVGKRDNSLIFAEYYVDSENSNNNRQWVLNRSNAVAADDIGSWGEVLRFTGLSQTKNEDVLTSTNEKYGEDTVLTVDEINHTVEISAPSTQTTIGSVADFAMISLCFQINADENPAVSFDEDWSYDYESIAAEDTTITLGKTLSLSGTGLTGLTRDNSETEDSTDADYCVFKGKFVGGGNTLTLAIGEPYGYRSDTELTQNTTNGNGMIYRHLYNGLFAIVDRAEESSTYTVQNLIFDGVVNVYSSAALKENNADITAYCGAFAARAVTDFKADTVTVETVFTHAGARPLYLGRLLGEACSDINVISVTDSTFSGDVTAPENTIDGNSSEKTCLGGVIGIISHNSNAARSWTFDTVTISGEISNSKSKTNQRIGGLIACIAGYSTSSTTTYQSRLLTLDDVVASNLKIEGSVGSNNNSTLGGLLGYSWYDTDVEFTDVDISSSATTKCTVSVSNSSGYGNMAGLVYAATGKWNVADLDINALDIISDASVSSFGLLVNTGWTGLDGGNNNGGSAIYMLLPTTGCYYVNTANVVFGSNFTADVFDEIVAYSAYYRVPDKTNTRICYPKDSDEDNLYVLKNGAGVVSIHTDATTNSVNSGLIMNGSDSSQSYAMQTTYKSQTGASNIYNPYTRYYYNLDNVTVTKAAFDANAALADGATGKVTYSAQQKLMSWGLNTYAHKSIKKYFANPYSNNTIENLTYNMTGYSWYPVDMSGTVTVNGTFTFANQQFEGSETKKATSGTETDKYNRTSLYDSANSTTTQHFLLHEGLFRNVSGTVKIGNPGVIFSGNVAAYSHGDTDEIKKAIYCGALVCGTVAGGSSSSKATVSSKVTSKQSNKIVVNTNYKIQLNGIIIYNIATVNEYAPLLINVADSHSNLEIYNVFVTNTGTTAETTSYYKANGIKGSGSKPAGTSLIGNAGTSVDSEDINLDFGYIKLDGRKTSYENDSLSKAYCTDESIFSKATLLNHFVFSQGSRGIYNYTIDLDWTNATTAIHNVTYGREVGYTDDAAYRKTQYPNQERKYLDSGYFTNSNTYQDSRGNNSSLFIDYFLPYVREPYNSDTYEDDHKNQLEVNHSVVNEIKGCGTYDDPYLIAKYEDILYVQNAMNGNNKVGYSFNLPNSVVSTATIDNTLWCGGSSHTQYRYVDGTNGYCKVTEEATNGDTSQVLGEAKSTGDEIIRRYLAGAYYKITSNITIPYVNGRDNFQGLGKIESGASNKYDAIFHGVIEGSGYTITNQTRFPFIFASSGCVVKNLTVIADVDGANTSNNRQMLPDSNAANGNYFNAYSSNTAYGVLIGRVLGGDNIIDKVTVSLTECTINLNGNDAQKVPIGGYIGVVVDGGVFFRNMDQVTANSKNESIFKNVTWNTINKNADNALDADPLDDSNNEWLYINPIIGRVINGYAVTEAGAYRPFEDGTRVYHGGARTLTGTKKEDDGTETTYEYEDTNALVTEYWLADGTVSKNASDAANAVGVTMRNGNKNYSITDIDENSETKLAVTSDRAISISDSQTFFLMSIMVNSGMCVQSYSADSGITGSGTIGYYKDYNTTRHSTYDNVGVRTDAVENGVYKDSKSDLYTAASTPYLLDLFADKYAKIIANGTNGCTITLSSGTYTLPDGFKGIGNIYARGDVSSINLTNLNLYVTNFTGNGAIISQNTTYNYYYTENTTTQYDKYAHIGDVGLGLFNTQSGVTNNKDTSRYYNFTLTGNVVCNCINYKSPDGDEIPFKGYNDKTDFTGGNYIDQNKMVCVGSLMGISNAQQYIDSVALVNVYVKGIKCTGGMIGGIPKSNTTIQNTWRDAENKSRASEKIKVHGAGTTGGMLGKSQAGNIDIDNGNATYSLTEVVSECVERGGNDYNYGVGGFIGVCRTGSANANNYVKIQNVIVGTPKMDAATFVKCDNAEINAGGMIGVVNKATLTLNDCKIYNQSVSSQYTAAGLVGYFASTGALSSITDTEIYCNDKSNAVISSSANFAGGFLGAVKEEMGDVKIMDSSVSGYEISSTKYAGGVVGEWGNDGGGTGNKKNTLYLNNFQISECGIYATGTSDSWAGGLIGHITSTGSNYKHIYGYNILEKNLSYSGVKKGYICGHTSNKTNEVIELVGFSRQDTRTGNKYGMIADSIGQPVDEDTLYGTGGYVIFADYTGASLTTSGHSGSFSTINQANNVTYKAESNASLNYSPFVTTSDRVLVDSSLFLTGDAVGHRANVISYQNSRIGSIMTDVSDGTDPKRYQTAKIVADSQDSAEAIIAKRNAFISKLDTYGKYASYKTEMEDLAGTSRDFPVLIVDDTGVSSCTAFINNYIRFLTNTDFNYATSNSAFNVEVGACVWNGSSFVYYPNEYSAQNTNGSYLYHSATDGTFYINENNVEKYDNKSTTGRFSLIDVQFYDPASKTTPKKIAYHLYVPVLVKKMLHYNFNASVLTGTNYRPEPYEAVRGNTLIENIGNPVTLEVQWTYERSLTEWQSAMESGESLLQTFDKKLQVNNHQGGIPSGADIVLVDQNNRNKRYYAKQGDSGLWSHDDETGYELFDMNVFKDTDNNNAAFASIDLNDFFTVTAETVASDYTGVRFERLAQGTTRAQAIAAKAVVYDGLYYYKINNTGTYKVTLSNKSGHYDSKTGYIKEAYYITFFTNKNDATSLYHLEFYDCGSFRKDTYPTKVGDNDHPHLLTGNIFINNFSIVDGSINPNDEMSLAVGEYYNDSIYATLEAEIGIQSALRNTMKTHLNTQSVEIYQSFLAMLNRQDDVSQERGILVRPVITVTNFTINHKVTENGQQVTKVDQVIDTVEDMSDVYELMTSNYIELRSNVNLKDQLRKSCNENRTLNVTATINLSYPDDTRMKRQFPTRKTTTDTSGTLFGASSNMSSNKAAAAYSKTVDEEWDDTAYYCTINTNADLILNSDDANNKYGEFYQLGVNGLDPDEAKTTTDGYASMRLNAYYDVLDLTEADSANSMKLKITLTRKEDYEAKLDIDTFVQSLTLYDKNNKSFEATENEDIITVDKSDTEEFVYIVPNPRVNLDYDAENKTYQIPITFNVIAGDDFEDEGLQYSNYMVHLEVELYTDTAATTGKNISGSKDDDHVIYTNAKIKPEFIHSGN